LGRSLGRDSNP